MHLLHACLKCWRQVVAEEHAEHWAYSRARDRLDETAITIVPGAVALPDDMPMPVWATTCCEVLACDPSVTRNGLTPLACNGFQHAPRLLCSHSCRVLCMHRSLSRKDDTSAWHDPCGDQYRSDRTRRKDPAFKQRLMADPTAIYEEVLGQKLADGIVIKVVEETPPRSSWSSRPTITAACTQCIPCASIAPICPEQE